MKNKKRKLLVKIVCAVMALIMTASVIVPVLNADPTPDDLLIATEQENVEPQEDADLPEGLTWDEHDKIIKVEGNITPAVVIGDKLNDLDAPMTVYFANMFTEQIYPVTLEPNNMYAASVDLPDGDYIVFNNSLGYEMSNGKQYTFEQPKYVHVGGIASANEYPVPFEQADTSVIELNVTEAPAHLNKIPFGDEAPQDNITFPTEYKLVPNRVVTDYNEQLDNQKGPNAEATEPQTEEEKQNPFKVFMLDIWNVLKDYSLLFLLLLGCGVTLYVIKQNKMQKLKEQEEYDQGDDGAFH